MRRLPDGGGCTTRPPLSTDGRAAGWVTDAQRGDLWGLIQECADAGTPFSEHRIMSYFCQICLALHHLQQRGILHRDLKTQNIFLSDHNMIKVHTQPWPVSITHPVPRQTEGGMRRAKISKSRTTGVLTSRALAPCLFPFSLATSASRAPCRPASR